MKNITTNIANKIDKQSPDLRQEMLDKLKKLYPPLFDNEGMLNQDELEQLVSGFSTPQTEKYEFNWAGKQQSKKKAFIASRATLRSDEKRSVDFNNTENLIIEGDNLEVLKLLQKSYFGKIKCIYIDPPYNTGNDFIYSDDYSEDKQAYWEKSGVKQNGVKLDTNTDSSGRYHSNWLSMMNPRLLLARNLLKEDGVIFVSIDEKEFHNLKKIMDEVFGEENYSGEIVWKNSSKNDQLYISMQHEYILCYVKDKTTNLGNWNETKSGLDEIYSKFDELKKIHNKDWNAIHKEIVKWYQTFSESNPIYDSKHYSYIDENGIYFPSDISGPNYGQYRYDVYHPITNKVCKEPASGWRYPEETMKQKIKDNLIHFGNDETTIPNNKTYLKDTEIQSLTSVKYKDGRVASKKLKSLMGGNYFNNPKDTDLIANIFRSIGVKNDDTVLDFFAGSGTTAHTVMDLNKEDGGNRKFILVQIPESTDEKSEAYKAGYKTISEICIERVKRAGKKFIDEGSKIDAGFKVFKLASSHFPENNFAPNPEKSDEENKKALESYINKATSQNGLFKDGVVDLIYEIALKDGFELTIKMDKVKEFDENVVYKVTDSHKEAFICVDDSLEDATIKQLEDHKDQRFICLHTSLNTTKKWNLQNILGSNLWLV